MLHRIEISRVVQLGLEIEDGKLLGFEAAALKTDRMLRPALWQQLLELHQETIIERVCGPRRQPLPRGRKAPFQCPGCNGTKASVGAVTDRDSACCLVVWVVSSSALLRWAVAVAAGSPPCCSCWASSQACESLPVLLVALHRLPPRRHSPKQLTISPQRQAPHRRSGASNNWCEMPDDDAISPSHAAT